MIIYDDREAKTREIAALLNPRKQLTASVAFARVSVNRPEQKPLYAHFSKVSFTGNFYFQGGEEK